MEIINSILEYIFPERPDHKIVSTIEQNGLINFYQPTFNNNWIALSNFSNNQIRASIHEAKFHNNEIAFYRLAELLEQYLKTRNESFLIIPIPLSKTREKERGYNQVTKIAQLAIRRLAQITIKTNYLIKTIDTIPQTKLTKVERMKNVTNAYEITEIGKKQIKGANIILLDDVVTTGATLSAAKATLLPHSPASITCVTLAH